MKGEGESEKKIKGGAERVREKWRGKERKKRDEERK